MAPDKAVTMTNSDEDSDKPLIKLRVKATRQKCRRETKQSNIAVDKDAQSNNSSQSSGQETPGALPEPEKYRALRHVRLENNKTPREAGTCMNKTVPGGTTDDTDASAETTDEGVVLSGHQSEDVVVSSNSQGLGIKSRSRDPAKEVMLLHLKTDEIAISDKTDEIDKSGRHFGKPIIDGSRAAYRQVQVVSLTLRNFKKGDTSDQRSPDSSKSGLIKNTNVAPIQISQHIRSNPAKFLDESQSMSFVKVMPEDWENALADHNPYLYRAKQVGMIRLLPFLKVWGSLEHVLPPDGWKAGDEPLPIHRVYRLYLESRSKQSDMMYKEMRLKSEAAAAQGVHPLELIGQMGSTLDDWRTKLILNNVILSERIQVYREWRNRHLLHNIAGKRPEERCIEVEHNQPVPDSDHRETELMTFNEVLQIFRSNGFISRFPDDQPSAEPKCAFTRDTDVWLTQPNFAELASMYVADPGLARQAFDSHICRFRDMNAHAETALWKLNQDPALAEQYLREISIEEQAIKRWAPESHTGFYQLLKNMNPVLWNTRVLVAQNPLTKLVTIEDQDRLIRCRIEQCIYEGQLIEWLSLDETKKPTRSCHFREYMGRRMRFEAQVSREFWRQDNLWFRMFQRDCESIQRALQEWVQRGGTELTQDHPMTPERQRLLIRETFAKTYARCQEVPECWQEYEFKEGYNGGVAGYATEEVYRLQDILPLPLTREVVGAGVADAVQVVGDQTNPIAKADMVTHEKSTPHKEAPRGSIDIHKPASTNAAPIESPAQGRLQSPKKNKTITGPWYQHIINQHIDAESTRKQKIGIERLTQQYINNGRELPDEFKKKGKKRAERKDVPTAEEGIVIDEAIAARLSRRGSGSMQISNDDQNLGLEARTFSRRLPVGNEARAPIAPMFATKGDEGFLLGQPSKKRAKVRPRTPASKERHSKGPGDEDATANR